MTDNTNTLALGAAFLTVLLWAFAFPASRAVLPWFNVEQVVLFRYMVACAFYLLLFMMGKFPLPKLRDVPALALLGFLGVAVYQLAFVYGMGRVAGGAAAMIITANPVCVALLARIFLGEKLPVAAWIGILVSLTGVSIIALIRGTDGDTMGYMALLLAMFAMAFYFVFQKPFFSRYSPLAMTSWTSIAGTIPLLFFLPDTIQSIAAAPTAPILWIVAMGILSSGIGFLLWFYALSKLRAGIVTSFLFLQPVFVTLLSWWWLGEFPENKTFIGGAVVLLGLSLIMKGQLRLSRQKE